MLRRRVVPLVALVIAALAAVFPGGLRAEFPVVVLQDDFEDPQRGVLPRTSTSPADFWLGYTGGKYRIWKLNPTYDGAPAAFLSPVLADSSLAIDAWLTDDTQGGYLDLWCRRGIGPAVNGYRLSIFTRLNSYLLTRWDGGAPVVLASGSLPTAIADQWFRAEFQCAGPRLTGLVNGVAAVSVEDATHQQGQMTLGAGVATDHGPGTVDAWFDNFILSRPQ